jgi:thioredoxin 1
MANVVDVTDETFDAEVIQSDKLVAAEFYTRFCPVCKRLAPVFEELSNDYAGRVKFVKLNVAQAGETARKFAVMSAPTTLLLKSGQELARHMGFADRKKLSGIIDAHL